MPNFSSIALHFSLDYETILERMMRLARDLTDNVTFYFKEELYLYFFEFFGPSSLSVGWAITAGSVVTAWLVAGKQRSCLEVMLLCKPHSIQYQFHFCSQSGVTLQVPYFPKGNCV